MAKLTKEESKRYRKYHIPHCGNLNSVKLNAIFINKHNSIEHEKMKFDLAWDTEKYLTEAERSATPEEVSMFKLSVKKKIIDFVDLVSGMEIEIIHKHENDKMIKFYRDNGTMAILVGETMKCSECQGVYPKRTKRLFCQNCAKKLEE